MPPIDIQKPFERDKKSREEGEPAFLAMDGTALSIRKFRRMSIGDLRDYGLGLAKVASIYLYIDTDYKSSWDALNHLPPELATNIQDTTVRFGPIVASMKSGNTIRLSKAWTHYLMQLFEIHPSKIVRVRISQAEYRHDQPLLLEYVFHEKSGLKIFLPSWTSSALEWHLGTNKIERVNMIFTHRFLGTEQPFTKLSGDLDGIWNIDHRRSELRRAKGSRKRLNPSIFPKTKSNERGLLIGNFHEKPLIITSESSQEGWQELASFSDVLSDFAGELGEIPSAARHISQRLWKEHQFFRKTETILRSKLDSKTETAVVVYHVKSDDAQIKGLILRLSDGRHGYLSREALEGMSSNRILQCLEVGQTLTVAVLKQESDGLELGLA